LLPHLQKLSKRGDHGLLVQTVDKLISICGPGTCAAREGLVLYAESLVVLGTGVRLKQVQCMLRRYFAREWFEEEDKVYYDWYTQEEVESMRVMLQVLY
jgi:hypothetical protein